MEITDFVDNVIVGTAILTKNVFKTAYVFLQNPSEIIPSLSFGAKSEIGIVPPVTFFVVSVSLLILVMLPTVYLLVRLIKNESSPENENSPTLLAKTKSGLMELVKNLEWKWLLIISVLFLIVFAVFAWFVTLVAGLFSGPIEYKVAFAISCYFGGTMYLCLSIIALLVLPQWANKPENQFQPRPYLGYIINAGLVILFLGVSHSLLILLSNQLGSTMAEASIVVVLSLLFFIASFGLLGKWVSPLFNLIPDRP